MFLMKRLSTAGLILVLGVSANANIIGNDTDNFNPSPSALDFVTVHGSQTLTPGLLSFSIFANRARNTLPSTVDQTGARIDPDDVVTFMDVGLAYGISSNFEMGFVLSTLLAQEVDHSVPGAQFAATGLNDIRILSKYRFLHNEPVGAAAILSMDMNQARNNPFSGRDSGPTVNLEGALDYEWQKILFAVNAGYRIRSRGAPISGALYRPLPDQYVASLAASYYFSSLDLKVIGEGFFAKSTESVSQIDASTISTEFLLGLKYDINSKIASQLGVGSRMGEGLFTPEWRVYLGISMTLDLAPATPAISPVVPAAPSATIVQQYYKGYLPEDIERLKAVDFDEMARTHEFRLQTEVPAADSSTQKPPFEILRLGGFDFDFASDAIRPEHHALLNKVADYLKAKPAVLKIRIEGHTDSIGADERKRTLGLRRAKSVADYLRKAGALEGVDVEPIGYGADRPIADNGNYQGRKQNRRVEIRILRRLDQAPTRIK